MLWPTFGCALALQSGTYPFGALCYGIVRTTRSSPQKDAAVRCRALFITLAFGLLTLPPWSGATDQEQAATPALVPALAEFVREVPVGTDLPSAPAGVAVDAAGTLYVINGPKDTVRVFDRDGKPIAEWGESGSSPGQFAFRAEGNFRGDLALGPDGNIYVLDPFNSRVQVFAPDGTYVREWGEAGAEPGQLTTPTGIAVDGAGLVYVADGGNQRLQVFDGTGQLLASWDGTEAGGGSFRDPADVTVDAAGRVFVIDRVRRRVYRFATQGTDFTVGGGPGVVLPAEFVEPWGAAIDAQGTLYVADYRLHRVDVFAPDGTIVGSIGSMGMQPGQFLNPSYLTVGADGLLYVADEGNRRVQVFRLLPAPVFAPGTPVPA
jgi:tripartite motif-containing protein 71